jgi:hypothetical protein
MWPQLMKIGRGGMLFIFFGRAKRCENVKRVRLGPKGCQIVELVAYLKVHGIEYDEWDIWE